jgi:hypothetical protein
MAKATINNPTDIIDGGTIYNQWIIIDWRGHPQFEGYYKWEEPSIIHGLLWMGNHL